MVITTTKPIKPTVAHFDNEDEEQKFMDYALQAKKTESVGMDRMREQIRQHKDKRV